MLFFALFAIRLFESEGRQNDFDNKLFAKYLNDILNDGISFKQFKEIFPDFPLQFNEYKQYASKFVNENFKLGDVMPEKEFGEFYKIMSHVQLYISKDTKFSVIPGLEEFLTSKSFTELYPIVKSIVQDLGPSLCDALNLDYKNLEKATISVLENFKTTTFGDVMNTLGIPTDALNALNSVIGFAANKVTIKQMFDAVGVDKFNEFLKVAKKFVVNTENDKFISVPNAVDLIVNFFSLAPATCKLILELAVDKTILPVLDEYVFPVINIFDRNIPKRAEAVVVLLETIQAYPSKFPTPKDTLEYSTKYAVRKSVAEMLEIFCTKKDKDCKKDPFPTAIKKVRLFTSKTLNLQKILVEEFGLAKEQVKVVSDVINALTNPEATFADLLDALSGLSDDDFEIPPWEEEHTLKEYAGYLKKIIDFTLKLDGNSNIKTLLEEIKLGHVYRYIKVFIENLAKQVDFYKNEFFFDEDDLEYYKQQLEKAKAYVRKMVSQEAFPKNDFMPYIEYFQHLTKSIIEILDNVVTPLLQNLLKNKELKIKYDQFVTGAGKSIEGAFELIDSFVPSFVKDIPYAGELYILIIDTGIEVGKALQDTKTTAITLLDKMIKDGVGVVLNMVASFSTAAMKENAKWEDVLKATKPTTFINVYQTLKNFNELKVYSFTNIAKCVVWDSSKAMLLSATISLDDVIPVKTVIVASEDMSTALKNDKLTISVVASSTNTDLEKITKAVKEFGETISSPPVEAVKLVAVGTGVVEDKEFDKMAEQVQEAAELTSQGKDANIDFEPAKGKTIGGLSVGAFVGIIVACVVVVAVIVGLVVYFVVFKKGKKSSSSK